MLWRASICARRDGVSKPLTIQALHQAHAECTAVRYVQRDAILIGSTTKHFWELHVATQQTSVPGRPRRQSSSVPIPARSPPASRKQADIRRAIAEHRG